MTEVKYVGQTYEEYLREVRAIQFGRHLDTISPITENTSVIKATTKEEKPNKASKKEEKADE